MPRREKGRWSDRRRLRAVVVTSLCASGAHFAHNAVFLDAYPGPPWITGPWLVVAAWCVVASVLVRGYLWHLHGKRRRALAAVTAYCGSSLLVFGHYLYGHPRDFDLLTNALILTEGVTGIALLVYFVGWARRGASF
jgi:hypothetical protein